MNDSGYGKPLLNSVILQSKDDGGYISCGGVYSNDVNNNIDYGFNFQCQRFHENRWSFDENMTLNEMRNSSGFSYHNSRFVKYIILFIYIFFMGEGSFEHAFRLDF